jgi:uncharacterized membrane protein YoaK (UPF0700 family)
LFGVFRERRTPWTSAPTLGDEHGGAAQSTVPKVVESLVRVTKIHMLMACASPAHRSRVRYSRAMLRYEKRYQVTAIGLAALAGFVDALGFMEFGGLFVSFMSGNSTRMAVGSMTASRSSLVAASLIAAFLTGVVGGAMVGRQAGQWRKQAVLGFVTALLLIASVLTTAGLQGASVTFVMACAMGAANNVFQRDGEVTIGVTYMTGTLVKIGQKLADILIGKSSAALYPFLLLWLGLVAGGIAGAIVFPCLGLRALWIATAFAACLLGGAIVFGPVPIDTR